MRRALLAAIFLTSLASPALADGPLRRTVEVTIHGTDDPLLDATIRELLGRSQLVTVQAPAAQPATLLARVTIETTATGVAHVVVIDARDGHVVMSRDLVKDATPSIAREEIAHAIQSAVEAELIEDEARAAAPSPPPPPPAPIAEPPPPHDVVAPPPPSKGARLALDVATFAGAGPIAKGSGIAPRVGGGLTLAWSSGARPSITLAGAYAPPFENDTDVVSARTSFVAVRLLPAIQIARSSSIALDAVAGGGIDMLDVDARSDVLPASSLGKGGERLDAIFTAMLTMRASLVPSVVFFASAGADADVFTRDYVLERGGVRSNVLSPWRVRPVFMVGFAFTALGPPVFE